MRSTLLALFILVAGNVFSQSYYLFIGTYTDAGSKGIYVYHFNASTGKAEWVSNTEGIVNPSFLTIAPNKKYVYAVTETATNDTGSVSAFSFDRSSGKLSFINKQNSGGANPCHVTTDRKNKWLLVGNYTGGSLAALQVNSNGSLQPHAQVVQHTGTSINKTRQNRPHVHCTVLSPDQKFLLTPDLGLDKIMIYAFNRKAAQPLTPANQAFATSEPGSGPRHITFHPNKRFAYLAEEITGTVVVYQYKKGVLTSIERQATHPADYKGLPGTADIHVSPDGKFLYVSNRGEENNIAIFSINEQTGMLTSVGYKATGGKTPRNFMIDPTGNYLLAANQNTNNIVIFKRDQQTGLLTKTGDEIKISKPVCLQMMQQ
jgi:6-phosphogluconolactonase